MDAAPDHGLSGRLHRVSPETRFVVAAAVAIGLMVAAAAWVTFISTTSADPIGRTDLGIPSVGVRLAVGRQVALVSDLVGNSPTSQVLFTGATVPHVNGLRIGVYTVRGHPVRQGEYLVSAVPMPHHLGAARLAPIAGTALRLTPQGPGTDGSPYTTVAIVVSPLRPGCFAFSGVSVHYRVGDAEFAKTMDGTDTVGTPGYRCPQA